MPGNIPVEFETVQADLVAICSLGICIVSPGVGAYLPHHLGFQDFELKDGVEGPLEARLWCRRWIGVESFPGAPKQPNVDPSYLHQAPEEEVFVYLEPYGMALSSSDFGILSLSRM